MPTTEQVAEADSISERRPKPTKQKVSISLAEDAAETVRNLADARGTTITEVIRRGIALERFIIEQLDEGACFLVQRDDGSMEKIHFLF